MNYPSDNDDMYINSDDDIDDNINKYKYDDKFLFNDIIEHVLGSTNIEFDSNCIDIEMSVSAIEDDYTMIEYKQENNNNIKEISIIEDFLVNDIDKQINNENNNQESTYYNNIINHILVSSNITDENTAGNNTVCDITIDNITIDNTQNNIHNNAFNNSVPNVISSDDIHNCVSSNDGLLNNGSLNDILPNNESLNDESSNDESSNDNKKSEIITLTSLTNFFDCFNDEISINNSIVCDNNNINSINSNNSNNCDNCDNCDNSDNSNSSDNSNNSSHNNKLNELTTSYMFENEDLKKVDVYPFDDDINMYEKNKKTKTVTGRISVIVVSAMMLISGSWLDSISR